MASLKRFLGEFDSVQIQHSCQITIQPVKQTICAFVVDSTKKSSGALYDTIGQKVVTTNHFFGSNFGVLCTQPGATIIMESVEYGESSKSSCIKLAIGVYLRNRGFTA